jgi:hypothetical protein
VSARQFMRASVGRVAGWFAGCSTLQAERCPLRGRRALAMPVCEATVRLAVFAGPAPRLRLR